MWIHLKPRRILGACNKPLQFVNIEPVQETSCASHSPVSKATAATNAFGANATSMVPNATAACCPWAPPPLDGQRESVGLDNGN